MDILWTHRKIKTVYVKLVTDYFLGMGLRGSFTSFFIHFLHTLICHTFKLFFSSTTYLLFKLEKNKGEKELPLIKTIFKKLG